MNAEGTLGLWAFPHSIERLLRCFRMVPGLCQRRTAHLFLDVRSLELASSHAGRLCGSPHPNFLMLLGFLRAVIYFEMEYCYICDSQSSTPGIS